MSVRNYQTQWPVGLPNVKYTKVSIGDIKNAIIDHSKKTTKEEVEASRKGPRAQGVPLLHDLIKQQNMDESEGQIY